jgi:hypothetical protein
MSSAERKTSPVAIAFAWIIVAIPLGWGVYQSVVKSGPLFAPGQAAAKPVTPAAAR